MKIAIRMDDISPNMDWEKFKTFKALLDEYKIKPLIGVVPDNKDENLNRSTALSEADFWQNVRTWKEEGWGIALHGHQHVYTQKKGGMFPLNHFSEFAGLSLEEQKTKIKKGQEILASHEIRTDMFMAPAHSYDKNTLLALKELGYDKITDGFGTKPYIWKGITFYPISFKLSSSLKKKVGITTLVVHTNTMEERDFQTYRQIFEKKEIISYEEYLSVKPEKRTVIGRMKEYMMANIKHLLVKLL